MCIYTCPFTAPRSPALRYPEVSQLQYAMPTPSSCRLSSNFKLISRISASAAPPVSAYVPSPPRSPVPASRSASASSARPAARSVSPLTCSPHSHVPERSLLVYSLTIHPAITPLRKSSLLMTSRQAIPLSMWERVVNQAINHSKRTSAASAAFLLASAAAPAPAPAIPSPAPEPFPPVVLPPSVRGGPPTLRACEGTLDVVFGGGAESRVRPGWEKASSLAAEDLPQMLPMISASF